MQIPAEIAVTEIIRDKTRKKQEIKTLDVYHEKVERLFR